MAALTHIDDDRGRFAGLAAILLAVFAYALLSRFEDWKSGVDLLVTGIPAVVVLAVAIAHRRHAGPPPGWISAMLVAGFALSTVALFSLADVLGANTDDVESSTVTWIAVVLALGFGFIARRRSSAICTLLAAAAAVVAIVAAVDWAFSPESPSTFRYVLLVLGIVLLAAGVAVYRDRGRHGVVLVVLSGLVILVMIVTFAQELIAPIFGDGGDAPGGIAWGWELAVLAFGIALAAFAVHTREPGPGYAAAILLSTFTALAAAGDGFVGWPLVLLVLLAAAIAGAVAGPRIGGGTRGGGAVAARPGPDEPHEVRL
jgi:peptidoglycan/LPS O-acetylase OafA/YrhL